MTSVLKKTTGLLPTLIALGLFVTPVLAAENCDLDSDGYISIPTAVMGDISTVPYNENGNYTSAQWQEFYSVFNQNQNKLPEAQQCQGLNFKKGAEPKRCDAPLIDANSNVYDPAKVTTPLSGSSVNPAAFDIADNSVDENCDGKDATLISAGATTKELGGLVQKVMGLLRWLVIAVSIAIMVWGGILYATAAGDETKTSKARKAIIGALIGLLIGLLAPVIVNLIAANLI